MAPPQGIELKEYMQNKYGFQAALNSDNPNNPLNSAGRKVGIKFNPNRRIINTVDCHRVMEWCNINYPEKCDCLMDILFHSYFVDGLNLSNHDIMLNTLGSSITIPSSSCDGSELEVCPLFSPSQINQIRLFLRTDEFKDVVLAKDLYAKSSLQIQSVPHTIFSIQPELSMKQTPFHSDSNSEESSPTPCPFSPTPQFSHCQSSQLEGASTATTTSGSEDPCAQGTCLTRLNPPTDPLVTTPRTSVKLYQSTRPTELAVEPGHFLFPPTTTPPLSPTTGELTPTTRQSSRITPPPSSIPMFFPPELTSSDSDLPHPVCLSGCQPITTFEEVLIELSESV